MRRAEGNFLMAATTRIMHADRLFNPDAIAAAIDELAKKGHRQYRVVQEFPFDLSDTDAAKALEEWLDHEQFHYVWQKTFLNHDPLRPVYGFEYPELEITW